MKETSPFLERHIALLLSRRWLVLGASVLCFAFALVYSNILHNRFTAVAKLNFDQTDSVNVSSQAAPIESEDLVAQKKLLTSRKFLDGVVRKLSLAGNQDFAYPVHGFDPLMGLSGLFSGLGDGQLEGDKGRKAQALSVPNQAVPSQAGSVDETLEALEERLAIWSVPGQNDLVIAVTAFDPKLAARIANGMADLYLGSANETKASNKLEALRARIAEAQARLDAYRAKTPGFASLSGQTPIQAPMQAPLSAQLQNKEQALTMEAQAKLVREKIYARKFAEILSLQNDDVLRRLLEQRLTQKSQLALEARVLPQGHARLKALSANLEDLDTQIQMAAEGIARSLENSAHQLNDRGSLLPMQSASTASDKNDTTLIGLMMVLDQAKNDFEIASKAQGRDDGANTQEQDTQDKNNHALQNLAKLAHISQRAIAPRSASGPKRLPFIITFTLLGFLASCLFVLALAGVKDFLTFRAAYQAARLASAVAAVSTVAPEHIAPLPHAHPESEDATNLLAKRPHPPKAQSKNPKPRRPQGAFLEPDSLSQNPMAQDGPEHIAGAQIARGNRLPPADFMQNQVINQRKNIVRLDGATFEEREYFSYQANDTMPHFRTLADLASGLVTLYDGHCALRILVHEMGENGYLTSLDLARRLSRSGRAVFVDFDVPEQTPSTGPSHVAVRSDYDETQPALIDLLHGDASFGEIIQRDQRSRLHIIRSGTTLGFAQGLDKFLDALGETYAYVVYYLPRLNSRTASIVMKSADLSIVPFSPQTPDSLINRLVDSSEQAGIPDVFFLDIPSRNARPRRGRTQRIA